MAVSRRVSRNWLAALAGPAVSIELRIGAGAPSYADDSDGAATAEHISHG
jgi:hypothetical protein